MDLSIPIQGEDLSCYRDSIGSGCIASQTSTVGLELPIAHSSCKATHTDLNIVLAAFGTIGGALFGCDVSSMSAWISSDQYLSYFDYPDSTQQGGITASMSGGSFLGALAAGFLSDRFGRRGCLMMASCVWIVGAALQCSAQNVAHLVVGRMVSGLAVGVTSSQVCVYLAELAPGRIRGRIVGIQQWAIEWGMLIMYLICYGCSFVDGPAAFRIAWGIQGIPGLILLGALMFFPESPRWLGSKERWEECLDTLALIHGNGDRSDPIVQAEYLEGWSYPLMMGGIQR